MSETPPELSFDRATYASPSASAATTAPCSSCKRPLANRYWKWQRMVLCDACRDGLAATLAKSQSGSSFGKALLMGGGAALGCGIAYMIAVVALKGTQMALLTIGIGYVVATAIRKASSGVSGRRFQVLAVALTYVASAMGYAPGIFDAMRGAGKVSIAFLFGLTLAAPFLELTEAPLGVVIIAIGLWEAWRRSRGLPVVIEGPFQVAQAREVPRASEDAAPPAA